MAFRSFTEKEIRKAILTKINPTISNKKADHWRGKIMFEGKYYRTVKIPNPHLKEFGPSKAKNIANQLGINDIEYNLFMECTLSGKEYYNLISKDEE